MPLRLTGLLSGWVFDLAIGWSSVSGPARHARASHHPKPRSEGVPGLVAGRHPRDQQQYRSLRHDPENPGRWPSRSEAVHSVCCQLVRRQVPDNIILGILTDPEFGISESIFRTADGQPVPSPEEYARRQI